eukprot:7354855-Pyramimonas_sp.AAC.1
MLSPAEYASSLAISNRAGAGSMRSFLSTLTSMRAVPEVSCRSFSKFSRFVLVLGFCDSVGASPL